MIRMVGKEAAVQLSTITDSPSCVRVTTMLPKLWVTMFTIIAMLIGSVQFSATAATAATAAVGSPSARHTEAPLVVRESKPTGQQVPASVRHGAYAGRTRIVYPDNGSAAYNGQLVSTRTALQLIRLDDKSASLQRFKVQSINLRRWSDVERQLQIGGLSPEISPNRLVYDVVALFNTPFQYKGNAWSSGRREIVVDAQSGVALFGRITGNQTASRLVHPK